MWLAMKYMGDLSLEVLGIYTTRDLAVAACDSPTCFIGEVPVDQPPAPPRTPWESVEFPLVHTTDDDS